MITPSYQPVPSGKRWTVYVLVFATVWLTGAFTAIDWAVFVHRFDTVFSEPARFLRSVFCVALACLPLRHAIHQRDARLLAAAFVFAGLGDYFLILTDRFLIGVGAFLLCHLILTVRHARGLRAALAGDGGEVLRRKLVILGLVALSITGALVVWAWPVMAREGNQVRDIAYMSVLTVSMWMGWTTVLHRCYPRDNAWMIAVGMTSFYICDVALGLGTELQGSQAELFGLVPDLTYTPALMLVALSGYFWDLEWVPDP